MTRFTERGPRQWRVAGMLLSISAIICVLAQVSGHLWAQATEVTEAHAKASWLLCFAQYVNWRDEDFASKDAPVILGILGESPFDKKEVEYLRSVTIQKRPIETRFLKDIEDKDAAACQVLFI